MRDSNALPDLRMLPTPALVPHEERDPRRVERLCLRLREEGVLKNPPVVAAIPRSEQYVILDGANRALALAQMGVAHIVAQLVSYADPGLTLDTWYHIVSGMEVERFEAALAQIAGLQLQGCTLEEARAALATNRAAAYIIRNHQVRMVFSPDGRVLSDIHLLNNIVGAYKGKADIYRASNDIWEIQQPYYPKITALVVFPRYSPSDILAVAANGDRVPSGVTRHIIPNRALHINIPLSVLEADWPLQRKEAWLHEWLMERMAANAIRYYSESTFSFDE
ncbi:MAG: hypothetical protein PHD58_08590 [Anaerolineales bacterium]|nr:hypothetical protein [Anaerolineales bacterium]